MFVPCERYIYIRLYFLFVSNLVKCLVVEVEGDDDGSGDGVGACDSADDDDDYYYYSVLLLPKPPHL